MIGNTDGVLTISPKSLTYLLSGASRVYGSTGGGSSVGLSGVLAGDDVDASLTLLGGGALAVNTPVGDYVVGVGGLTGASASNYLLGGTSGATLAGLTITPRPLTYAIAGAGSTYGTLATLGAADLSGVVTGDSVSATVRLSNGVTLSDRLHAGTYGQTVIVEHGGGDYSVYGSLSRITVAKGAHISKGQVIGEVGTSDPDLPPHLHFEIRHGGPAVDPTSWLRAH